jgi:hypothetical protein
MPVRLKIFVFFGDALTGAAAATTEIAGESR